MAQKKTLLDEYGIIHQAIKTLPDEKHKIQMLEALAELEDNQCHASKTFPKTRFHRVVGYRKAIYRADIDKTSGWRIHVQYNNGQLHLKDIINGKQHDNVIKIIKAKKNRYD
jgi:hypothetical protein